jgi:hypothetical protein
MHELPLDKATIQNVKNHQYYVFPPPATHTNDVNRPNPQMFADPKILRTYNGKGSNGSAQLHPDVMGPANLFMSALIEYGEYINDWSMRSAVIQSAYRPSDETQGATYLDNIKAAFAYVPDLAGLQFPANLEREAQSELGCPGDPRLSAFMNRVAQSPGWTPQLAGKLFAYVHGVYAPRGCNPHATGYVFDVNFWYFFNNSEQPHNGKPPRNWAALTSAAGVWINLYSKLFCFDSYDTGKEIWHMEYRKCEPPSIPAGKIPFTA